MPLMVIFVIGKALDTFKRSTIWQNYQEGKEKGLSREEIKQEYGMREGQLLGAGMMILVIGLTVSYQCSIKILEKKEY